MKIDVNTKLLFIIDSYLKDVSHLVRLLKKESGQLEPLIAYTRRVLPKEGFLRDKHDKISYNFHGAGCRVIFNGKVVDFDFGPNFRCDGFEPWKVFSYIESDAESNKYFPNIEALNSAFDQLVSLGLIIHPPRESGGGLYYLSTAFSDSLFENKKKAGS